tara:strand:+ start:425 stop:1225 length:801 start_codon:yes stop_codon:yes gene_type:complete
MNEEKEYRAAPGLNYSNFKHIGKSPLHYQHQLTAPHKDLPAWVMGRLIHLLTFEPFQFEAAYMVWDGRKDKRTKAYKEALEEAAGREVVTPAEHERALVVAKRITAHPTMRALLARPDVQCEKPLFWDEAPVGPCKGKPDLYVVEGGHHLMMDLKTFNSTDGHQLQMAAFKFGWHLQMAHYLSGLAHIHGIPTKVEAYLFVAEQEAPHDVRCFKWSNESLELAFNERQRLLDLLAECTKTNTWPGRGDFGELSPPRWLTIDNKDAS